MFNNADYYLSLLSRINGIYEDVFNKDYNSYSKLYNIKNELESVKDEFKPDDELCVMVYKMCCDEIKVIELLYEKLNVSYEKLCDYFVDVEKEHFEVVNKYVMGIIVPSDIEKFKNKILNFKNILYNFKTDDKNIYDIAKMKSKIQHYSTEVLEDEEVLRTAYRNENV